MSDELTRLELEALESVLRGFAQQPPPNDVPIPFSEKGCRRVGEIISQVATTKADDDKTKKQSGS